VRSHILQPTPALLAVIRNFTRFTQEQEPRLLPPPQHRQRGPLVAATSIHHLVCCVVGRCGRRSGVSILPVAAPGGPPCTAVQFTAQRQSFELRRGRVWAFSHGTGMMFAIYFALCSASAVGHTHRDCQGKLGERHTHCSKAHGNVTWSKAHLCRGLGAVCVSLTRWRQAGTVCPRVCVSSDSNVKLFLRAETFGTKSR
jgi:hypothetical protein